MAADRTPGTVRLSVHVGLFVLLGFPLVAYLWETANRLLSGRVEGGRLLLSIPVLALFVGLLVLLARAIRGWEGDRQEPAPRPGARP